MSGFAMYQSLVRFIPVRYQLIREQTTFGKLEEGCYSFLDTFCLCWYHVIMKKSIYFKVKNMMKSRSVIVLIVVVACCLPVHVAGSEPRDDVLATIEEAVKQYKVGDYAGASSNLDYASQLVRQKKSERMKDLLPDPLSGWQAKTASAQTLGTAVFGGGVTVSREYSKGSSSVAVEIVSDSPVLQSVMVMLNNPMFAGASGGSLKTIKGQRAIVKYDDKERNGEINIVVASRFMVTVKGHNVDQVSLDAYAGSIDFETLAKN